MAEKQNPGYIEQLREMRALRTQQLRGMTADQRFYANMNSNQRALIQANQKLAASFDSMSRTFVSSIKGLTSAVGSIASKGVSAAGSVAGGAASLAGSIASGLGKVLPLAITGIVAKMLLWDNLTGENKNRILSSVSTLFSNIFGGLPDLFRGILQKVVKSISEMDIKFPILTTLMQKTEAFVKLITAGFELAKLKFEDLMEFFGNIKDPMKIFESGLKAISAATLFRLLLPATVSLVSAIVGNRLLMGRIGDALDSRIGGPVGGGGGAGKRARRAGAAAAGAAAVSAGRKAAGRSAAVAIASKVGASLTTRSVIAFIPVVGQLALLGYTAYEIYEIARELGFTEDEAEQLKQEVEMKTDALDYYGPVIDEKKMSEVQAKQAEIEKLQKSAEPNPALPPFEQEKEIIETRSKIEKLTKEITDITDIQKRRKSQLDNERTYDNITGKGGDIGVLSAFNKIWNQLSKFEKQSAIDMAIPIIETENFVYIMGKDRKIHKMKIDEYLKLRNELDPLITEIDRAEFERMTGKVIMKNESASNYNAFYGMGDVSKGSIAPPKNLTEMTGQEVLDYQEQLRKSTAGKIGQGEKGTSAVGAYQLTKSNVTDPYYALFPEEKGKLFNQEQQDKIYRWFINDAVNQFMATGDKKAFSDYVTSKWEIFSKDPKAKKELDALLDNPVFIADAGDSTKKQTKEQRAVREKLLMKVFEQAGIDLFKPGDTTIATIKGESAVDIGVKKVENVAESVKDKLTGIFKGSATVEEFLGSSQKAGGPGFEDILNMFAPASNKPAVTIINNDNKSSSSSYTGSAGSSMDIISKAPYNSYTAFNSLAGGMPQT